MATNGVGFVITANGFPVTNSNASHGTVLALSKQQIASLGTAVAQRIDSLVSLANTTPGYAKNGTFYLNLSASTPLTIDLTAIASAATSQAGDNSFSLINDIQIVNVGTQDVAAGNAAANSFLFGLAPTNGTYNCPANSTQRLNFPNGLAVNSTAKNFKFDPGGNAAQIAIALGGA